LPKILSNSTDLNSSFPTAHEPALTGPAYYSPPASNQQGIAFFEKAYCVVCWLFFCNGIPALTGLDDPGTLMKLIRYGILAISMLFLILRWKRTLRAISKGGVLWVFVGLMLASVAWSISPSFTTDSLRGEVLPMTIFALYFASRFNMREQMQIVGTTLGIAAIASLFFALAVPSVGRHVGDEFDGAWKGIYPQKNNFSTTMTMTMLLFFVLSIVNSNHQERLIARVGLFLSVAMILLSTSVSGLIVFITMTLVVFISRLFRWRGHRSVLILDVSGLILLGAGAVLSGTWQAIVINLGKDPTLSARTYIWTGSIQKIMQEPLLGYGRAAFWHPDSVEAAEVGALAAKGFIPSHAHNGFIDVALELGLIGLGIFLLGFIPSFGTALRRAYKAREPEDLWPFAFFCLMVVSNLTETVLITRTSPYWVMYMTVFLSLRLWPRRTGQASQLSPPLAPDGASPLKRPQSRSLRPFG
jgi:exopolysaccharide production protein ExoQ